jgi:hypothetical protein
MAAVTLAKGGDRAGARQLWTELYTTADVEWLRRAAENRLQQLQAMDEIDALTAIVGRYTARTGRAPSGWTDLVAARLLPGTPADPTGVPYELEPGGGITVSKSSALYPLPTLEAHR